MRANNSFLVLGWLAVCGMLVPAFAQDGKDPRLPNSRGHYDNGGYDNGYNRGTVAEVVIDHPRPDRVAVTLGAYGVNMSPIRVPLRTERYNPGYDNDWGDDDDRWDDDDRDDRRDKTRREHPRGKEPRGNAHGYWRNRGRDGDGRHYDSNITAGVGEVRLDNYARYLDGRTQWYLQVQDHSGEAGRVEYFAVNSGNDRRVASGLPAYFGPNGRIELRLVPAPYNNGGYYPPGNEYPYPGDPTYSNGAVTRNLPARVQPGQRMWIEYVVRTDHYGAGRLGIMEQLPPEWQLIQAQPQPQLWDPGRGAVGWDTHSVRNGERYRVEVQAPYREGRYDFSGNYRLDSGSNVPIAGNRYVQVGNGYYDPRTEEPRNRGGGVFDRNGDGRIDLGDIFGGIFN